MSFPNKLIFNKFIEFLIPNLNFLTQTIKFAIFIINVDSKNIFFDHEEERKRSYYNKKSSLLPLLIFFVDNVFYGISKS